MSDIALGTAPAVRPALAQWWSEVNRVVATAVQRIFTPYPPRRRYMDDAVMKREIYRL